MRQEDKEELRIILKRAAWIVLVLFIVIALFQHVIRYYINQLI